MKFALVGYGRMGREIERLATRRGHVCVATLGSPDSSVSPEKLADAEVAFEFTCPAAARSNVAALIDAGVVVVCGTTGWEPDQILADKAQASTTSVVIAPNFSIGMSLFYRLVREAARAAGALEDSEEIHDPLAPGAGLHLGLFVPSQGDVVGSYRAGVAGVAVSALRLCLGHWRTLSIVCVAL